jgi:membrane protein required for beta-lactamase induction
MWLLGRGLFRPFGPLGLALLAYRIWRRLSPARKAALKSRARQVSHRLQGAASR